MPLLFPAVAYADAFELIDFGVDALTALFPLAISLAVVVFMWGIVKFVAHAGDEKAVEEGKQVIVYGLAAIFVIVTLWGIVGFITTTLDLSTGVDNSISIPTTPG